MFFWNTAVDEDSILDKRATKHFPMLREVSQEPAIADIKLDLIAAERVAHPVC